MSYEELSVGDCAFMEKTISESDVYAFAGITGDFNPVHMSKTYAEKTRFGERIAHGMLVGGLFSAVQAMRLFPPGAIYISQTMEFLRPVKFGDTITVTATIVEKCEKRRLRTECVAKNQLGDVVARGEGVAMLPK